MRTSATSTGDLAPLRLAMQIAGATDKARSLGGTEVSTAFRRTVEPDLQLFLGKTRLRLRFSMAFNCAVDIFGRVSSWSLRF